MIELTDGKGLPKSIRDAASFVLGMPTNGRTDWKDSNGCSLKEREENL